MSLFETNTAVMTQILSFLQLQQAPRLYNLFANVSNLSELGKAFKAIPALWIMIGHCLMWANSVDEFRANSMLHYWVAFLGAYGGGSLTSILIGDYKSLPIGLFASNMMGVTWTICWWIMNASPSHNLIPHIHKNFLPFRLLTKICVTLTRTNAIVARVDLCWDRLFPGVLAPTLFLGPLAASGGRYLVDAVSAAGYGNPAAAEFTIPTANTRTAFMSNLAYWALCKATHVLSADQAYGVVTAVVLFHTIATELFGPKADFTLPIARLLHAIFFIPMSQRPKSFFPSSASSPSTVAPTSISKKATGSGAISKAVGTESSGKGGLITPPAAVGKESARVTKSGHNDGESLVKGDGYNGESDGINLDDFVNPDDDGINPNDTGLPQGTRSSHSNPSTAADAKPVSTPSITGGKTKAAATAANSGWVKPSNAIKAPVVASSRIRSSLTPSLAGSQNSATTTSANNGSTVGANEDADDSMAAGSGSRATGTIFDALLGEQSDDRIRRAAKAFAQGGSGGGGSSGGVGGGGYGESSAAAMALAAAAKSNALFESKASRSQAHKGKRH